MAAFTWGQNGKKLTPDQVARLRIASELMKKDATSTTPVASPFAGLNRALQGYLVGRDNKRSDAAEEAGLASADAAIAGILGGQGGSPSYTASSSGGGSAPSGSWTPDAPAPSPVDLATQGMTGGAAFAGQPAADPGAIGAQGGLDFGAAVMTPQEMLVEGARRRGLDPIDVATAISYETGGKFDPMIAGPTTQWGTHRGLIQFGEPQAKQHGVDFSSPEAAWRSQLNPENGAIWKYLDGAGVKPGMGLPEIYSGINAGSVGRMGASDANNGGAPGTVADKVATMGPHRDKAAAFLGGTWTPDPNAPSGNVTMSAKGEAVPGGTGGADIAALLALQANPWVTQKYGGVVDALMGQQFDRQNALWEQQQRMADPMYQAQLEMAQLELQQAQAPAQSEYDQRAAAAVQYGLQPGTPQYQQFVLGGDPFAGGGEAPNSVQEYEYYARKAVERGETPMPYEAFIVADEKATVPEGTPNIGTIPPGFSAIKVPVTPENPSGFSLVPIPGGPAALEAEQLALKEGNKDNQGQMKLGTTLESINLNLGEIENGGLPVTGLIGDARRTWLGRALTGDSAVDFGNRTNQITDQAALAEVQNMRDNSPTGGAVGSLTDSERVAIGNSVTAINNSTSPEEYARAAKAYRKLALDIAYGEGTWELGEDGQPVAKTDAPPPAEIGKGGGIDGVSDALSDEPIEGFTAEEWQFLTPEEKAELKRGQK